MVGSLREFKGLSLADQKKVNKQELVDLILNSHDELEVVENLTKAVESLNEIIAEYKVDVVAIKHEQANTSVTVTKLVVENRLLLERVRRLEEKSRDGDQRSRSDNIEIIGVSGKDSDEDEKLARCFFENWS